MLSGLDENSGVNRRRLFQGGAVLSVGALLALGNAATPAVAKPVRKAPTSQDVELLNAAIALEHEGIAAYQISAESGLLTPDVLKVGILFQSHHKQHRDDLMAAVARLGGRAVASKTQAEYATALNAGAIKNQTDILNLALGLETGATNAYLGLIGPVAAEGLELLVARLAADESFHVGVLSMALGRSGAEKAPLFG